jgi:uncharacterized protein YdhG (YjbR/CyaY superfamily)
MKRLKAASVDDYFAALSEPRRSALETLRAAVRAAAPKAEECVSYGLPAFRLDGKILVAYGVAAAHCALYPMSGAIVDAFQKELARYDTSKGTIRFQPEKPLPAALVRKIVRARMAENQEAKRK